MATITPSKKRVLPSERLNKCAKLTAEAVQTALPILVETVKALKKTFSKIDSIKKIRRPSKVLETFSDKIRSSRKSYFITVPILTPFSKDERLILRFIRILLKSLNNKER